MPEFLVAIAQGIQDEHGSKMTILGLILLFVTCGVGYGAIRKYRAYRVVIDTPRSKVRSAPQSYVELQGVFEPLDGEELKAAPFSKKPCVWYQAELQKYSGGKNKSWKTVFHESDPRPCQLRDDTGSCLIAPAEVDEAMRVNLDTETFYPGREESPEPVRNVEIGFLSNSIRYIERRITPGTEAYAIGVFTTFSENALDSETGDGRFDRLLRDWKTDYLASSEGRPDINAPNSVSDPTQWFEDDHDRDRSFPLAAIHWARQRASDPSIANIMRPSQDSRRPMVIGIGDDTLISQKLRTQTIALTALFVIAAPSVSFFWLAFFEVLP